jgi:hypothetical protein
MRLWSKRGKYFFESALGAGDAFSYSSSQAL